MRMVSDIDSAMSESSVKIQRKIQTALHLAMYALPSLTQIAQNRRTSVEQARKQQIKAMRSSHKTAQEIYKNVYEDEFWQSANPDQIATTVSQAAKFAPYFPEAKQALDYANDQLENRYGFRIENGRIVTQAELQSAKQSQEDTVEDINTDPESEESLAEVEEDDALDDSTEELLDEIESEDTDFDTSYAQEKTKNALVEDVKESNEASELVENSDDLQMDPTNDKVQGVRADIEVEEAQQSGEVLAKMKADENALTSSVGPEAGVAWSRAHISTGPSLIQKIKRSLSGARQPVIRAPRALTQQMTNRR